MYGHVRENQFVVTDLQHKVALQTHKRITNFPLGCIHYVYHRGEGAGDF